jgi:hypothetical protein
MERNRKRRSRTAGFGEWAFARYIAVAVFPALRVLTFFKKIPPGVWIHSAGFPTDDGFGHRFNALIGRNLLPRRVE